MFGGKPNVVVFISDDQGWGDFSFNGNANIDTPRIDSLAQEGVSFDRFFVCPVCAPTRSEFLTGRYHSRSGVRGVSRGQERINLDEQTIGDVFKSSGYATALFGKWHNGMQHPYHPNARGFDEFYGFCSGHWGNYFDPMLERNGAIVKGEGFLTDDITNKAIAFMESNRRSETPFFVTLAFNTPHSPMQVPDPFWERLAKREISMRHREPAKEKVEFTRAALAMCENIDWNVGRILDTLSELGIEEETIVLYFNDNGPNSPRWNEGMKGRKGSLDEGGVRSPLFIRWPGRFTEGRQIKSIASVTDLLPTLMELCEIEANPPRPLDGKSLSALLLGKVDQTSNRSIFTHHRGRFSIRDQRYRLDNDGRLFHIEADPGQQHDIAASQPEMAQRLSDELDRLKSEAVLNAQPDDRPFTIGHPDAVWTQLPARDAISTGNIERSNRYPNCSYFLNWSGPEDSITWNVESLSEGNFEVQVYYACPQEDLGSTIELEFLDRTIEAKVAEANDPPLIGAENDRIERAESYVKEWKPMTLGTIRLTKGRGPLILRAPTIPGKQAMEFRLLMLKKLDS